MKTAKLPKSKWDELFEHYLDIPKMNMDYKRKTMSKTIMFYIVYWYD